MTPEVLAVLEMMKKQSLQQQVQQQRQHQQDQQQLQPAAKEESKKHAFWDTQVREIQKNVELWKYCDLSY